ncbi:NAD(P)/FAD-dependent oxidoreductase [Actinocorallia sp. A-T 12471]|uniref:NAD(P)/FAD-dependent oxidoreductase n=1 Tax=Actinocorallia sp. A-T 12471 TaxID=3089813 RepID=UPI0029D1C0F9|nr:NAD(P)/FAD-dependent oxidoreductase [Actinocorallia sp. A-T 12471]MDX6741335.1 NAD(P)/FAD-dependent oxidoreductase [Actinocorallia sp. A-T 12471]
MRKRILIVGGGYVGLYTALRLQRKLRGPLKRGEVEITVVDPQGYMTYQPFLPEAAAGNLEPRHVIVPLRRVLRHCKIINGHVTSIEHARKSATVEIAAGEAWPVDYDLLVLAVGSVSRTLPIPGLAEHGIGFKTIEESIQLRNQVLGLLDRAASTRDPEECRRCLTFVFVGGGFAGVEALAELQDMAQDYLKWLPALNARPRWVLVEATDRILPEVGPELGVYTVEQLRQQEIEVLLNTRLNSAVGGRIELSDGKVFEAATLVWTAGVKPHPLINATDLPKDDKGRLKATVNLTVEGHPDAFTAGDNAAVPDLTTEGAYTAPNAQHAVRQARCLADNVLATLRGHELRPYKHAYVGSVASLGLYRGVAQLYGVKVRGLPAWFIHRTYHLTRLPTLNRKARVLGDWTFALFFRRQFVALGSMRDPYREFDIATGRRAQPSAADTRARASS